MAGHNKLDPASIGPLLEHLTLYGEITAQEARGLRAAEGLEYLLRCGYLVQQGEVYPVTERWLHLLPVANLTELTRRVCFADPAYRNYLTAVSAAQIVRCGLEGGMAQVEEWLLGDLGAAAGEVNALLDRFESEQGVPVKDSPPEALVAWFNRDIARLEAQAGFDINAWNRELLGVSGDREAIFAALRVRRALAVNATLPASSSGETWPPIKSLNDDLSAPCGRPVLFPIIDPALLESASWEELAATPQWKGRRHVFGGIPLDVGERHATRERALQEAFCQHPISWLLIQLGIYQRLRLPGSEQPELRLKADLDEDGVPRDLMVELDGRPVGSFLEHLPLLLHALGWRLVLPLGRVPSGALSALLEAMMQAGVLALSGPGQYILADGFSRWVLERDAIQRIVRAPKGARNSLVTELGR